MKRYAASFVAHSFSGLRFVMAMLFVSVASSVSMAVALVYYLVMLGTDVVDGIIARAFHCDSKGGAWLDSLADRTVCIASVLFGASVGVSPLVCGLLLSREIFFASLPGIIPNVNDSVRGRFLGLVGGIPLRVATAFAVIMHGLTATPAIKTLYSIALAATVIPIPARLWHVRHDLSDTFRTRKRAILLTADTIRTSLQKKPAESPDAKADVC